MISFMFTSLGLKVSIYFLALGMFVYFWNAFLSLAFLFNLVVSVQMLFILPLKFPHSSATLPTLC